MTRRGPRLLLLLALALPAGANELRLAEQDIRRTIERTRPSVVVVETPEKRDADQTGVALGSGDVILTARRTLLTPEGALPERVALRFPESNGTATGELIADDEETDTVLYRAHGGKARAIRVGRASDAHLGMWVLLIGNAFGTGQESQATVGLGTVSGLVRENGRVVAIHASALVNPGSIGAPLIDLTGDLLGIALPALTGAGGQSIVMPYDRVRERYKEMGGDAARAVGLEPPARTLRPTVTDQFGMVIEEAVTRARGALVGVRRRALPPGVEAPAAPEPPAAEGGAKAKRPPAPTPVPGRRPALDRSSGLVVAPDGWIVCPLRVTGWPGPVHLMDVDLLDGRTFPAEVRGYDERLRVALLKIDTTGLPVLEEQPSRTVRSGQFAVALGYPHGEPERASPHVTVGIVSRVHALRSLHPGFDAVQTDAGVSGGNRGGPLVDVEGRLLGMLLDVDDADTMGYRLRMRGQSGANSGLGFALPAPVLRELVSRLEEGAVLRRGMLGLAAETTPDGLVVRRVTARNSEGRETAAAAAGLQPGDRLVSLDGTALATVADLVGTLAERVAGDEIEIVFERGGERTTVRVVLDTP